MKRSAKSRSFITIIGVLIGLAWMGSGAWFHSPASRSPTPIEGRNLPPAADEDEVTVRALFDSRTSDAVLTTTGVVARILADDNEGDRHQRFLVEVPGDVTVLIAHNIDLAKRVPLREGDAVVIRGEYEWTDKGGTIHWTHHDPKGWHVDGWVEHDGKRYG